VDISYKAGGGGCNLFRRPRLKSKAKKSPGKPNQVRRTQKGGSHLGSRSVLEQVVDRGGKALPREFLRKRAGVSWGKVRLTERGGGGCQPKALKRKGMEENDFEDRRRDMEAILHSGGTASLGKIP